MLLGVLITHLLTHLCVDTHCVPEAFKGSEHSCLHQSQLDTEGHWWELWPWWLDTKAMPALALCFVFSDAFAIQDHTLEIGCPALHCDISGMFPVPDSAGTQPESSMLAILGALVLTLSGFASLPHHISVC